MPVQLSVSPNPNIPFEVIYEDDHFIALCKPAGVVTQPGEKHQHDSLLNGAFSRWGKRLQNLGKRRDFGLLHRLDRDTSGLVLIALSAEAYDGLRDQFERRALTKRYWALLSGRLSPARGDCALRIAEVRAQGQKRARVITQIEPQASGGRATRGERGRAGHRRFDQRSHQRAKGFRDQKTQRGPQGQPALTSYQTLQTSQRKGETASLVCCEIKTGRLHQIRAHMLALGAPVIGDFVYGGKRPLNVTARSLGRNQIALHAGYLKLTHPCSGAVIELYAPASTWLYALSEQLGLSLPEELR